VREGRWWHQKDSLKRLGIKPEVERDDSFIFPTSFHQHSKPTATTAINRQTLTRHHHHHQQHPADALGNDIN